MIEIVGLAAKLPGAPNEREFWNVLKNGKCVVTEAPDDRWSKFHFWHPRLKVPGKSYTFAAGVLDDVWGFDPGYFGISPREAEQMDPQQRLLLQTTSEALENAGVSPSAIAGEEVGVYVGASGLDYGNLALFDIAAGSGHFMTGNTLSIIANRISYIFDFRGPSFVVDTACSSSLVALREAVIGLETGRIETAVVAGVSVLLSPFPFIGFANATMLSPEGLCRAFDEKGEGYVRAEGCISIVLRRKDAPRWAGQRSRGDVVAVDVNADGRTVGMSLPSPYEQASLLEKVYAESGVDPEKLAFIEAHGTGTRVGDPAEAQSIGTVLAQKRSDALPIGSVKTNIGHLEPASGLAGVAKSVLALENNFLPASLHFENPNPDIDFDGLNIEVVAKGRDLPKTAEARYAGVNSFGFGGTNAHVILKDAERAEIEAQGETPEAKQNGIFMLSALGEQALKDSAKSFLEFVQSGEGKEHDLDMIAAAAFHRKRNLREKLIIDAADHEALETALNAYLADEASDAYEAGAADPVEGKCAFVFSGNGSQWPGMAQDIYRANDTFRASFDALGELFSEYADYSLSSLIFADDLDEQLKLTSISQPLIFAVQVALMDAMVEAGFHADIVLGHSIGEAAAAVCSGKLTREEGVRLVYHRSSCQERAAGRGTMAALVTPLEVAERHIASFGSDTIEVAAMNSHKSLTISGPNDEIASFAKYARANKIAMRQMGLNYPFHSALIEDVEAPFRKAVGKISSQASDIVMVSTVSADVIEGGDLNADYWWRNLRERVNFAGAVRKACELGATSFIEVSPKQILQSYLKQELAEVEVKGAVMGTLKGDSVEGSRDPIRDMVISALSNGVSLEHENVFGKNPDVAMNLPTYPWQNKHYRMAKTSESQYGLVQSIDNPLLGWRANADVYQWTTHIDAHVLPFLADHVVSGQTIFPGAGYIEIALAVAREVFGDKPVELQTFDIVSPMRLLDDNLTEVLTTYQPETGNIEVASRRRGSDDSFLVHAKGRIFEAIREAESDNKTTLHTLSDTVASGAKIYEQASRFGLDYGPAFRRVKLVTKLDDSRLRVQLKPLPHAYDKSPCCSIHPAELDGCFGGLIALYELAGLEKLEGRAFVPVYFDRVEQYQVNSSPETVIINVRKVSQHSILADFEIFNSDDELILKMVGSRFRATTFDLLASEADLILRTSDKVLPDLVANSGGGSTINIAEPFDFVELLSTQQDTSIGGEERESRLLLDAAAQRTAFDLVAKLVKADRTINIDDLPDHNRSYWVRCIDLLIQTGDMEDCGEGKFKLGVETDLPEFDLLLGGIVEENPDEVSAATLLNLARTSAFAALDGEAEAAEFNPSAALMEHMMFDTPDARHRFNVLSKWLDPVLSEWPTTRQLRVLDLAGSGLALARHILDRQKEGTTEITVLETDAGNAARLSLGVSKTAPISVLDGSKPLDQILDEEVFDLIISSGRLHHLASMETTLADLSKRLRTGGKFLAVEQNEDLFHDVAFGLSAGWFDDSLDASLPVGKLKNAKEWKATFERSDYQNVTATSEVIDGLSLTVLRAESGGLPDDQQEKVDLDGASWIILCGDGPDDVKTAKALSALLEENGGSGHVAVTGDGGFNAESESAWAQLIDAGEADSDLTIVQICTPHSDQDGPLTQILAPTMGTVAAVKILGERKAKMAFVVSKDKASALPTRDFGPFQTAIWSFARVLRNEASNIDVTSLGVESLADASEAAQTIFATLINGSAEEEIIATEAITSTKRVERGAFLGEDRGADVVRLSFDFPGSLDGLKWNELEETLLGANDVRIDVAATGVNFRDVMWALGMLPEEALEEGYGGASLGLECSGWVREVGSAVTDVSVGDRVVAFTSHGYGNQVTVPEHAVARIGEEDDVVAAATLPVAFLTAYYSLIHLGRLKEDQWLLLHGAAGGVGLAALQIAKWKGAKVIATAGSDEKRALLSAMGADYVLNSRSLDFVDEVRKITGDGVHAVLNSLAGEAMERGINVVRPFGRFLELGKRDFYSNTKIGLRPFRKNVSYFGIDVDQLLSHEPDLARDLMGDLFALIREGVFVPLPYRAFEGRDVQDAFRLMQRSGHIGKILVKPPKAGEIRVPVDAEPLTFSKNAAHVVIGGLGGFGGEIAKWLADHGAETIILTSRSGNVSDEHRQLIHNLANRGVDVRPVACDVTVLSDIDELLTDIRAEMPIKSVIHSAMVIDDGIITELDKERFEKVMKPKVTGARNLAQVTWQDDLEHFILFSSATTLIGNPGQAHYVAANGYLEGLARERRAIGRPAIAVGWGAIGDVGFLARNAKVSEKLGRHLGDAMIGARKGLDLLAKVIERDNGSIEGAAVYIGKFDWSQASQSLGILKTPLFEKIAAGIEEGGDTSNQVDLRSLVEGKSESEALAIVSDLIVNEIAVILRLPVEDISLKRPLPDLGMDSLMGLELRMAVQKRFDLEVPLTALSGNSSVEGISQKVLKMVSVGDQDGDEEFDRTTMDLVSQHIGDETGNTDISKVQKAVLDQHQQGGGLLQ